MQKQCLKGYERGEKPITCRPADILVAGDGEGPGGDKRPGQMREMYSIYALIYYYRKAFSRWKYGLEPVPESMKPRTMEEVLEGNELIAKAKAGKLVETQKPAPAKGPGLRTFNIFVDDEYFEVAVEEAEV